MARPIRSAEQALATYVRTGAPDECWPWTGPVSPRGYGQLRQGRNTPRPAHRVAFELVNGPVPAELEMDHLCHTSDLRCAGGPSCPHRKCCNPAHLEAVSGAENTLRGRSFAAINASKEECANGHAFTEENTYRRPDGARRCRACQARVHRENKARKRAARRTLVGAGVAVMALLGLTSCGGNVPHLPGHTDGNRQIVAPAVLR